MAEKTKKRGGVWVGLSQEEDATLSAIAELRRTKRATVLQGHVVRAIKAEARKEDAQALDAQRERVLGEDWPE